LAGTIGSFSPRGGHKNLTRHVQLNETDSIFKSWAKGKNENWESWGSNDYIQLRVDTTKMDNS